MTDLRAAAEALRRLAQSATPGPWMAVSDSPAVAVKHVDGHVIVQTANQNNCRHYGPAWPWMGCTDANAAYIAAADPTTILALLAENRALRRAIQGQPNG
jgi:hypothetical protein